MSDTPDRRQPPNIDIERRVDILDGKIERVGDQVMNVGKEMRSALEMLIKQQDERWKWFEERSDMEGRNQKQSIELLTSSTVKMQQDVSSVETQVQLIETEQRVGEAKLLEQKRNADLVHDELLRRIEAIAENLKWVVRTLAAALVTLVVGVLLFVSTH